MYRIFIVEDDYTIAGVLQRHLSAWGCEARCAQNFQDILPEFQDFAPHLVLMDITLPFFDGYHWCQEMRQHVAGADCASSPPPPTI